ncbi:hypothetical protein H0H93_012712 [Arthromyces matolae]|nr:hypothetical protein H0H93_012712 [Arthromyces matolae]
MPVDALIERASLFVGHPFSVVWLQEYVRHYGAETTSYIVRRFSGIPLGSAIQKIVEWAERAGKILSDFSRTLTRNPHLIRICLQPLDNVPNVFQPHSQTFISPDSDVIPNTAKITSKYPSLENSSGRWVYYDSLTDSIFSVDILSDSICLRRHLLGKGIPLRPAVLETHEPDLYSFRSAAVSARAGFIAITFGSSGVAYERLRETYTTVCWSLITSGSLSRTSEWAEVAFVDKAEGPKVEQFVNTVQEVDIVAFREDNTLMAPGGIWNILTEERIDGAREVYDPGAFSSIQNLCFSKDGAKVARVHTTSDNDVIQILTGDGTLRRESSYRRKSIRLLSFSRTGGKLVFDQRGDSIVIFCMITDTGFHIEFDRPPHFKFMQEPRFTKGEDRVVSTLFGVQVSDEDSGEHSFHQQGCSIGIWSLDRDSEGAFVSHASMIYLFKFWEGLDNITFCLNQLPSKRGHQLEDRMMVVTKTGTVIERNLNEAWTSQEEKDFSALGKESTTLQQSVLAEHITLRPMQPPEIIVCSNDGR